MKTKYIGVDLGGTHLRSAVIDSQSGNVAALKQIPTLAREGHKAVIQRMAELIKDVIHAGGYATSEIGAVGIGVPGLLDLERNTVLFVPNLPDNWLNVSLRVMIEEHIGIPTYLLNDARAMTYGEWKFGAGRGVDTIACFTLGTGIGGGLVINSRLHLGVGGSAGELGHQIVEINGLPCGCGGRGCLEVYASGPAIAAMGIKAVLQGLTTQLGGMVDYDMDKITPEVIYKAASQGDKISLEIYQRAGYYIGIAVSNVIASVCPRKVVIGGGVSQAGELLIEPIRKTVLDRVHIVPASQVQILRAELGTNAGLIGAAIWAASQSNVQ